MGSEDSDSNTNHLEGMLTQRGRGGGGGGGGAREKARKAAEWAKE